MTTLVPAAFSCAVTGRRSAPSRSAWESMIWRASGELLSMVQREVMTITIPPGRVRASDLTMKWLWMLSPWGLCTGSYRVKSPNGTLPITASKESGGATVSAKESLRMTACGCRWVAMAAVVGSSSTPTQCMAISCGANPMKWPEPHPGSRMLPPAKPSSRMPSHMAWTRPASV